MAQGLKTGRCRPVALPEARSCGKCHRDYARLTERPDVIITDYKMPEISGERLLMNLKYNDMTKNIPVIMVTGVTIGGGEDYALKRQVLGPGGAVSFMNKPLDFEALLMELRRHIRLPQQGDTPGSYPVGL